MGAALEDVRILDFTRGMAGSLGNMYLGDAGAEVIKLETIGDADVTRSLDSVEDMPPANWNYYFEYNNRNKKSIVVDIESKIGMEIIHRLVEKMDVFSSDLPGEILRSLRLDYEILSKINKNLIYTTCSCMGRKGPDKDLPIINELALARSGLMCNAGQPGYPPYNTGLGEPAAALELAFGTVLALFHRLRTGISQEVDVSLFGAHIKLGHPTLHSALGLDPLESSDTVAGFGAGILEPIDRRKVGNPLGNIYQTKDRWIFLIMWYKERQWHDLCQGLGIEELEFDPRFDSLDKRCGHEHREELIGILDGVFKTITLDEWKERWKGLEIEYEVVRDFKELSVDPQAWDNDFLIDVDHHNYGKIKMIGFPAQLQKTPLRLNRLAPSKGEHTTQIMVDILGYSYDEIADLNRQKVIF